MSTLLSSEAILKTKATFYLKNTEDSSHQEQYFLLISFSNNSLFPYFLAVSLKSS